jgi:hypothetical protein
MNAGKRLSKPECLIIKKKVKKNIYLESIILIFYTYSTSKTIT